MYNKIIKINKLLPVLCGLLFVVVSVAIFPETKIHVYKAYTQGKFYSLSKLYGGLLDRPIPVNFVHKDILNERLKNPVEWVVKQIDNDFSSYKDYSRANVIKTFNSLQPENLVVLFSIKDGNLSVTRPKIEMNGTVKNGLKIYTNFFRFIAKEGYVNNLDFLVRFSDFFPQNSNIAHLNFAPILTTSKSLNMPIERDLVLIPDYMSLEDIPKLSPRIMFASKQYPWKKKQNNVLWRGGQADISGFRHAVVQYATNHPNGFVDAKFVKKDVDFMMPEQQLKYKYLLNIDGHTAAWTRPIWQLLSNSVLVKQDSPLVQWYYQALEPGKHYVLVTNNPDLIERDIIKFSDDRLQLIAKNGSDFARQNLTIDDMASYIVLVLQKYESLQRGALEG